MKWLFLEMIKPVAVYEEDQQMAKNFWTEKVGFEVITEHQMGPNATRL